MTFQEACKIAYGPRYQQIECGYKPVRGVEPPIAKAAHYNEQIRQLKLHRDILRRSLDDTERLISDYEVLAGQIPF